jgi:SWI/SNF-related matrix-associated actin-dependent regulator of chromatin subfamily A-like protein 1
MSAAALSLLRDYQAQGIAWLCTQLQDHRAVLLADEMGLGKTLQALLAAAQRDARRVLIVCPAGARRVWLNEIKRWLPSWADRIVLVEPGYKLTDIKTCLDRQTFVLIVGYDEFSDRTSQLAHHLRARRFDLLICDEAHYLKNQSNRTQALYGHRGSGRGVQSAAAKVILLSGTPTPNHAGELWQHYRTFWPEAVKNTAGRSLSQIEFEDRFTRYRDTPFGRQMTGSKNQTILRHALRDKILRRRKDEVLAELPPLVLQDIPLAGPGQPASWLSGLKPETRALAAKLHYAAEHTSDDELLKTLRSPDTAVATVRRELGLMKVPATIRWVEERLASADKLLLFAWHHEVIDHLARGLAEFAPVMVTGRSTPNARALAVQDFQSNPGTRVFIGQILAAGTAITLTAASEVAIVEPSWVPGENLQAIARAHRLGQRDMVLGSFLYLPGTLDERIMRVFRRKATEISLLQGDNENASAA